MKNEKNTSITNPAEEAANALQARVASESGFDVETEPHEVEVLSHEETVSALAENVTEDDSVFEAKISGFGAKLQAQSRALRNAMMDETNSRLSQARILYAIDSAKLLKGTSYKGLGEYAEDVFNMKKSLASKLKNAYARFYATPLTTSAGYQLKLSPSQAEELLAANDDDIQAMIDSGEITDNMSSREIREAIKAKKPSKEAPAKVYRWKPVMFAKNKADNKTHMYGDDEYIVTGTAEFIAEAAEKTAESKIYMALTGSNAEGDVVLFIMENLSELTYQNLGEVKPEKKDKKSKK